MIKINLDEAHSIAIKAEENLNIYLVAETIKIWEEYKSRLNEWNEKNRFMKWFLGPPQSPDEDILNPITGLKLRYASVNKTIKLIKELKKQQTLVTELELNLQDYAAICAWANVKN